MGSHGAGFSNLAFCNENTNVLEVRPEDHPNKIYNRISDINNLNYKLISTKKINATNKSGDINLKMNDVSLVMKQDQVTTAETSTSQTTVVNY